MLAVAKHEASISGLPDLVDPTATIDNMGERSSNSMVEESEPNKDSMAEIADEVVELDRKVGLLTEANAQLEQERDLLLEEKVGSLRLCFYLVLILELLFCVALQFKIFLTLVHLCMFCN